MSTELNVNRLQEGLRTRFLGKSIFFSRQVNSTNEWAKKLASQGASEGTIAIAETQACGRGRLNRKWVSPAGGLWFSVILRPRLAVPDALKLTFAAGLAVAKTLNELYDLRTETQWPNDVLANGRKICGILGEVSSTGEKVNFVVLGIGLNANFDSEQVLPKSIRLMATSLENVLGRKIPLEQLFRALLEELETVYGLYVRKGFTSVLEEWRRYAGFLGREVEVIERNERTTGLACDVDQDGALILKLNNGTIRRVLVGDVSLRTNSNLKPRIERRG